MSRQHGIRLEGTGFWVRHRNRDYGPFDYAWSPDLRGVEFLYSGQKFGEFCSSEEIFADLKEFGLPMRVVEVTSVVMGALVLAVLNGLPRTQKSSLIAEKLCEHGYQSFAAGLESRG